MNLKTGKVHARKFTVAHYCGLIVNPALLIRAIEGCVCMDQSALCMKNDALHRVLFRGSRTSRLGSRAKAHGGGPLVSGTMGYGTTAQPGPLGLIPGEADRGPSTMAPLERGWVF